MFKEITLALAFCSLVGVGALPVLTGTAHAASTEERFQQSKIIMMTTRNGVPFYAEPGKDSLTLGFYPKGTIFVPINQTRNAVENKVYNLCIRFDGAVGWLSSDDVALTRK